MYLERTDHESNGRWKFEWLLTVDILVWLANIRPLTRWAVWTYGDFLDSATLTETRMQIKVAILTNHRLEQGSLGQAESIGPALI